MNWWDFLVNFFLMTNVANREYFNTTDGVQVVKVAEGNVKFHTVRIGAEGQNTVNIIEFPSQLMIIDFGFTVNDSIKYLNYAKTLKKPIGSCYLVQDSVDHFNGYPAWQNDCLTTLALNETISRVRPFAFFPNIFQDAARAFISKAQPVMTSKRVVDGEKLNLEKIAGIKPNYFLLITMPERKALFAGDSVKDKGHLNVAFNRNMALWFDLLSKYKKYGYRNVFMGHGFPVDYTNSKNYDLNVEYLTFIRDIANTYKKKEEYTKVILERFPDYSSARTVSDPFDLDQDYSG
jgi:hypothetical protein